MNRSMLSPCRPAIGHTSGVAADVAVAGRLVCKWVLRKSSGASRLTAIVPALIGRRPKCRFTERRLASLQQHSNRRNYLISCRESLRRACRATVVSVQTHWYLACTAEPILDCLPQERGDILVVLPAKGGQLFPPGQRDSEANHFGGLFLPSL